MLERIANYFYDPAVFWGVPLILAAAWEIYAIVSAKGSGPRTKRKG